MSPRLSVALQGVPGLQSLVGRLEQLSRQSRRPDQILLLDSGGLADQLCRLGDITARLSLPAVEPMAVPLDAPPSVWRDIGMRTSKAPVVCFLEPGVMLDDRYFELALDSMRSEKVGFATSWWARLGPSGEAENIVVAACDLAVLLARRDAVHPATLYRRDAWKTVGGFDTTLAAAEDYEMCLRLLSNGWRGGLVPEELVREEPDRLSSYQRELWRERYVPAMSAVFNKHRELFESQPATVLLGREEALLGLADRYRPIVARRKRIVDELDALQREIRELSETLGELGHDRIDWGDLRRTKPISPEWGYDRGKPIDRYYIEGFLEDNARHVRGRVLEIQEDDYSRRFGGKDLESVDVVDACVTNPRANVIADLRRAATLPGDSYDCIILTQTIHVIDDMEAVARECFRLLKPGGKLLVTLPCLSRVCLEYGPDGDYWRVTEAGAQQLFSAAFPPYAIETRVYGNVLAGTAFLYGLCCDEVTPRELDETDPYNPTLIGVCATKPETALRAKPAARRAAVRTKANGVAQGVILAYHGVTPEPDDPHGLFLEPKVFAQQMAHLRSHYRPMSLAALLEGVQRGSLPPGAVAVTFDDGYHDALTTVSPILVKHRIPATFFVATSALAQGGEHWWDLLARIFFAAELPSRELAIELEGKVHRFSTSASEVLRNAYWDLHGVLVRSSLAKRTEILRRLIAWSDIDSKPPVRRSMTPEEVKRLAARRGHSIGAHSVHHLALGHQTEETQQQEVMECKAALERLALTVDAFAYPYGDFNEETVRLVRTTGFRMAVTCEERPVSPRDDPYRLPRVEVKPGSFAEFKSWMGKLVSNR